MITPQNHVENPDQITLTYTPPTCTQAILGRAQARLSRWSQADSSSVEFYESTAEVLKSKSDSTQIGFGSSMPLEESGVPMSVGGSMSVRAHLG